MSNLRWKLLALGFALLALFQHYRAGAGAAKQGTQSEEVAGGEARRSGSKGAMRGDHSRSPDTERVENEGDDDDWSPPPVKEHWAITFLRPKPGENLLDYRDRVLPVAQAAVAPLRAKVRDDLADFREQAGLSSEQESELEEVLERRSEAIQDRIMEAIFTGEFAQGPIKPTSALAIGRSIFDEVEGMHNDVVALLSAEQGELLRESRFDVIEYLLFATRWEDMLGYAPEP